MDETLRIGLIGCGSRGTNNYGRLIAGRSDARVTAIAEPNPVRTEVARGVVGEGVHAYSSAAEMLAAEALDGLIVTSPDFRHTEHLLAGLDAGIRHILVEKPLATTAADCGRILDALQTNPARIAIGFNMRHLPVIRKIKEIIDSGLIGKLMFIENREFYDGGRTYMARWNRRFEWSGGLWVHKGSHDFDVFNWWNPGGNPVRVSAFAGLNVLRPEGIPFPIEEGKPVGPNCTRCGYAGVCPDYSPPVAGTQLFNARAAESDGYLQDLCMYLSDKDTHDNGIAVVEYDNNVRASHIECFICNFTDRFYTVQGDRGTLMAHLENPDEIEFPAAIGLGHNHSGGSAERRESWRRGFAAGGKFSVGIRDDRPHSSSVEDGVRAVVVGHAAEISWREHRTVSIRDLIDLPGRP